MRRLFLIAAVVSASAQPSCVVVGGYDSERGWYVWPGSLVFILVAVAVVLLLSRRRRR